MPDSNWRPPNPGTGRQPRNRFAQKLGTYLLGVAIGFVLFGWFQYRKHLALEARQAESQPEHPAPTPPGQGPESPLSPVEP